MMRLEKGDKVQVTYVDALRKTLAMQGVIDRYDTELDKWWVELPTGVALPFAEDRLIKL